MRKFVLAFTLVALLVPSIPAQSAHCNPATAGSNINHRCPFTFNGGNVPCAVGCAYWTDTANTDLDGDGNPEVYFQACDAPSPPGSFQDVMTTAPSPNTTVLLMWFAIFPLSDWDSFVCRPLGGGKAEQIAIGANILGELCDNVTGNNSPVPFGCKEYTLVKVDKGSTYAMRAYNWSDVPGGVLPLQASIAYCNPFASGANVACAKAGGAS